jgi:hypothetical protein
MPLKFLWWWIFLVYDENRKLLDPPFIVSKGRTESEALENAQREAPSAAVLKRTILDFGAWAGESGTLDATRAAYEAERSFITQQHELDAFQTWVSVFGPKAAVRLSEFKLCYYYAADLKEAKELRWKLQGGSVTSFPSVILTQPKFNA